MVDLPGASAARLHLRHRGRRRRVRPAHEGAAPARCRARPTEPRPGPKHPARVSQASRVCARRRHGARTQPPRWSALKKAIRQAPLAPVHLPRASRAARRQQQQRTRTAAHGHLPQGSLAASAPIGALTCSRACAPSSAPPHAAAWAPARLSSKPYAGRPSLNRVEQLPRRHSRRDRGCQQCW